MAGKARDKVTSPLKTSSTARGSDRQKKKLELDLQKTMKKNQSILSVSYMGLVSPHISSASASEYGDMSDWEQVEHDEKTQEAKKSRAKEIKAHNDAMDAQNQAFRPSMKR